MLVLNKKTSKVGNPKIQHTELGAEMYVNSMTLAQCSVIWWPLENTAVKSHVSQKQNFPPLTEHLTKFNKDLVLGVKSLLYERRLDFEILVFSLLR